MRSVRNRMVLNCGVVVFTLMGEAPQASAQRSFSVAHEPGNATQNGYVQAMTILNYWFAECPGGINLIVQVQPSPSVSRDYWFNGRQVNSGVAGIPKSGGLNRNVPGSVVGPVSSEVSANATTSSNPGCFDGVRVGPSSAFFAAGATDQEKQATLQNLGFSPHGVGNLSPLRNADIEAHYRAAFAEEARAAEEEKAEAARKATTEQQQQTAAVQQPRTPKGPSSSQSLNDEAQQRQREAARMRAYNDSVKAEIQRQNAEARQQLLGDRANTTVAEDAADLGGAVNGTLSGFRKSREDKRKAAVLTERHKRATALSEAAKGGDVAAQYQFGMMIERGEAWDLPLSIALAWYRRATKAGYAPARERLLALSPNDPALESPYEAGLRLRDAGDYASAAAQFQLAAESGIAAAQNELGTLYQTGRGVPLDSNTAVRWYRAAADQGYDLAQFNLAEFYARAAGENPRDDILAASRWFRAAMERASSPERKNLARIRLSYVLWLLGDDRYAVKDYVTAVPLLREAAEMGDSEAPNRLSSMYRRGEGVQVDTSASLRWIRLAVERGSPAAQYNLGVFFYNGVGGVNQDIEEAIRLFRLAAAQDFAPAKKALTQIDPKE